MFKLLLLILIIGFGVYKVINFLFRILFTLSGGKRTAYRNFNTGNYTQQTKQRRRAPNSDLNIDYVPEEEKKRKKGYKGGDYVDYEEVK
jgi:hypothetical protein